MSESNQAHHNDGIYHAPDVEVEPFPTLANSTMGGITAPIHPPHRFNDETLMYVAVRVSMGSRGSQERKSSSSNKKTSRLKSFAKALKRGTNPSNTSEDIRVIRMPRSDYIKYFARNEVDEYVGTEPERPWGDEDLEEAFGRYRDFRPTRWVMKSEDGGSWGASALVPGKEVFVAAEASGSGEGGRLLKDG